MSLGIVGAHYVDAGGGGGGTYADAIAASAPIHRWRLNEATGTTAADSGSASAQDGTVFGTPIAGGTAINSGDAFAGSFDGTSSFIALPAFASPGTALSVEAIFIPATISGQGWIFSHANASDAFGSTWSFILLRNGSDLLGGIFEGGTFLSVNLSGVLSVGVKYHCALVADATSTILYFQGSSGGSTTGSGSINQSATTPWRIGDAGTTGDDNFFTGSIAEVALYDRKLGSSEIATHYAAI